MKSWLPHNQRANNAYKTHTQYTKIYTLSLIIRKGVLVNVWAARTSMSHGSILYALLIHLAYYTNCTVVCVSPWIVPIIEQFEQCLNYSKAEQNSLLPAIQKVRWKQLYTKPTARPSWLVPDRLILCTSIIKKREAHCSFQWSQLLHLSCGDRYGAVPTGNSHLPSTLRLCVLLHNLNHLAIDLRFALDCIQPNVVSWLDLAWFATQFLMACCPLFSLTFLTAVVRFFASSTIQEML